MQTSTSYFICIVHNRYRYMWKYFFYQEKFKYLEKNGFNVIDFKFMSC